VLSQRIAKLAHKYPSIRARILRLSAAQLDRAKRTVAGLSHRQLRDEEALFESLNLLDDERSPELPYDLRKAIEEAFVEHRPTSENSNAYTLHPRAANELRDRLIEMTKSDPKRKGSAFLLLSKIELWRVEYGRPLGRRAIRFLAANYHSLWRINAPISIKSRGQKARLTLPPRGEKYQVGMNLRERWRRTGSASIAV